MTMRWGCNMHCDDLTARDVTLDETIRALENHCELLRADHDRTTKLIEHMKACKSANFPTGSVVEPPPVIGPVECVEPAFLPPRESA
jgi:hypothetical protein